MKALFISGCVVCMSGALGLWPQLLAALSMVLLYKRRRENWSHIVKQQALLPETVPQAVIAFKFK